MEEIKKYISVILKNAILKAFNVNSISLREFEEALEIPKQKGNGDYAFPCFKMAKTLRNSPVQIASAIEKSIKFDDRIRKIEIVNGYINFFIDKNSISKDILLEIIDKKDMFGASDKGSGKNVVIDYSSPNIAKPFHLGHFRNTVLGRAIYNLYKELGYNLTSINYLGDWGRQFGLIIEGYLRYKDEYDIDKKPLNSFADIYVRITKLAKEDENVMNKARDNFKRLEQNDEEFIKIWKFIREVSLKEYDRIYNRIGCNFDSYNGEAYYNDKMNEVIKILDEKGVLFESEGAKVVFVNEDEPPCIILKSDGATIYATRDLAAILNRSREYNFDKAIYVTSYEQTHYFKQLFEVAKHIVDKKYTDGLVHVPYGMVRLKSGKMSTRDGNVIYINDLIEDSVSKCKEIISKKDAKLDDIDKTAEIIGIGALIFNTLKQSKVKDMIFDLDEVLRYDGETGPYVQYTYVRTKSILNKAGFGEDTQELKDANMELLNSDAEINVIKMLESFGDVIERSAQNFEPSLITRYLVDLSAVFSKFYNDIQVNVEDIELRKARAALVYATSIVIKKGLRLIGIECPDRM